MAFAGKPKKILIIVENLPVPFDRRVWQEARTLKDNGYEVSVICPIGKNYNEKFQRLEGINIYRHKLPLEAEGALGYAIEYSTALFMQFVLSMKVLFKHGFDVIHACNPPDTIFLIGAFYKLFGKKFLFDHHDINPELYEAKFKKRGLFYRLMLLLERLTFMTADVSIATNESYKRIAVERGKMKSDRVFVVRSGPDMDRIKILPPNEKYKKGSEYLLGYLGVMGKQEGIDYLLRALRLIIFDFDRMNVHLILVGSGTELQNMKEYANELGLSDYVTFTGRVPDQEMFEILNTTDVCINPDVANEMNDKSTMNKIMEYMALGKPVVQFDLTEGRFSAQKASLYARKNDEADLAKKIMTLLDDSELRQEMGKYGRERLENTLSWKHQIPNLIAAYESLWKN